MQAASALLLKMGLAADFRSGPCQQRDALMLIAELDLGENKAFVLAGGGVDFPGRAGVGHEVATFSTTIPTQRDGGLRFQGGAGNRCRTPNADDPARAI